MWKRRFAAAALGSALLFSAVGSLQAEELKVGAVIGEVLSTDITAYVNGLPIPSMNIGGYTAVAVEDLRSYGFDVSWSPITRKLCLFENGTKPKQPIAMTKDEAPPVGTKLKDVVYTDIQSYYGDQEHGSALRSFNIGGVTAVMLNDLEPFGAVQWDAENRTIKFDAQGYKGSDGKLENPNRRGDSLRITQTSAVQLRVEFGEEHQYIGGKEVGIAQDGIAYFSLPYFSEAFGYGMTREEGNIAMGNGLYRIEIEPEGTMAELYWGGAKVSEYQLFKPLLIQEGKPYLAAFDSEKLFGYIAKWNQQDRILDISYADYDIEDYGLPREAGGDSLSVKGSVRSLAAENQVAPDNMELILNNRGIYGNVATAWRSGAEQSLSLLEAPIALTLGSNTITETLFSGERVLYRMSSEVSTTYSGQPLVNDNPGMKLDSVRAGYIRNSSSTYEFTGTAEFPFYVALAKGDEAGNFFNLPGVETATPDDQGHFRVTVHLPEGSGLYKVRLLTPANRPKAGLVHVETGYFYIMNSLP